jgi:hypothetical protein
VIAPPSLLQDDEQPGRDAAPYKVLWILFLLLFPFWLMGRDPVASKIDPTKISVEKTQGGVPQIADYVMAVMIGVTLLGLGPKSSQATSFPVKAFALFAGYAGVVNFLWSAVLAEPRLLMSALFYVYDVLLFLTFVVLYSRFGNAALRWTLNGVAASVFLQVLISPLAIDPTLVRQPLFFNNPLQLGYFAVLAGTLFYHGSRLFPMPPVWYQGIFYTAVIYLTLLSVSKACLMGLGILLILILLERPRALLFTGVLVGFSFVLVLLIRPDAVAGLSFNLDKRLETEKVDESLAARGYDRLLNSPEYVFLGAGEGAYERFHSVWPGELHSSLGTLVFSYGLVGTALFLFGIWAVYSPNPKLATALLPPAAYNLAEQGLRFAFFWAFLAFLCCLARATRSPSQLAQLHNQ